MWQEIKIDGYRENPQPNYYIRFKLYHSIIKHYSVDLYGKIESFFKACELEGLAIQKAYIVDTDSRIHKISMIVDEQSEYIKLDCSSHRITLEFIFIKGDKGIDIKYLFIDKYCKKEGILNDVRKQIKQFNKKIKKDTISFDVIRTSLKNNKQWNNTSYSQTVNLLSRLHYIEKRKIKIFHCIINDYFDGYALYLFSMIGKNILSIVLYSHGYNTQYTIIKRKNIFDKPEYEDIKEDVALKLISGKS